MFSNGRERMKIHISANLLNLELVQRAKKMCLVRPWLSNFSGYVICLPMEVEPVTEPSSHVNRGPMQQKQQPRPPDDGSSGETSKGPNGLGREGGHFGVF